MSDESERLVTVARFVTGHEAHMARLKLEGEGIPCFVADELAVTTMVGFSNALGGVKLQVPESRAEEAAGILAGPQAAIRERPEECPECGSRNVSRHSPLPWWLVLLTLGLLTLMFLPTFRCGKCGHEWNPWGR